MTSDAPIAADLAALLRTATTRLADAGVPSPRADAEHLVAHVRGVGLSALRREAALGTPVTRRTLVEVEDLLARRAAREPLQHLTGVAAFRHLSLAVGPGVFLPRPETEVLVDLALTVLAETAGGQQGDVPSPLVVDLCTGSGAIALALRQEHPAARVHAVELDPAAFTWARRNVAATGLAVTLRLADAATALPELDGTVDLVTANPPYIPPGAVPVDPEVRDHDPPVALYGLGQDGLGVPLAVVARAEGLLRTGGVLLLEHAEVQGEVLAQRVRARGAWDEVSDHPDLTGRPRVLRAVRAAGGCSPCRCGLGLHPRDEPDDEGDDEQHADDGPDEVASAHGAS